MIIEDSRPLEAPKKKPEDFSVAYSKNPYRPEDDISSAHAVPEVYQSHDADATVDVRNPFALAKAIDAPQLNLPADIERLVERARLKELERKGAGAASTRRAYLADWTVFLNWCESREFSALPAEPLIVARYMRFLIDRPEILVEDTYTINGMKVQRSRKVGKAHSTTVRRHLISIRKAARERRLSGPHHRSERQARVERHLRRAWVKPRAKQAAVTVDTLVDAIHALDEIHRAAETKAKASGLAGAERAAHPLRLCDRAILLCGWSGALRRCEIARVDVEHLRREPRGTHIDLPFSKTNQTGEDEFVLISRGVKLEFCGAQALEAWMKEAEVYAGAIFRHVDRHGNVRERIRAVVVAHIMKRAAAAIGVDPKTIGAHSLRSGWITTAAVAGRKEEAIMRHSRHKSIPIMRVYIRNADKWTDHAGDGLL